MKDKKEARKKPYTVYCSPEEIEIIEKVREDLENKQIKVSNSEIIAMAIRKLGEQYV